MDTMNDPKKLIPPHGGYRRLKSFHVAQLAYDVTVRFCDRRNQNRGSQKMETAEQCPIAAHGINRGFKSTQPSKPRQGRQNRRGKFLSPLPGLVLFSPKPTAFAVGYSLPPLRGCHYLP